MESDLTMKSNLIPKPTWSAWVLVVDAVKAVVIAVKPCRFFLRGFKVRGLNLVAKR
mgnify:CR=1 FL=1